MALKLTKNAFGKEFTDAYHRIDSIQIFYKGKMQAIVHSYADGSQETPFERVYFGFPYEIESKENPYMQAYLSLKGLPEFEGASDC
jgi:hypothetical protein